jgi:uncharacterized protein
MQRGPGSHGRRGLIPRAITGRLIEALSEFRVAALIGPRQAGKTTLVRELIVPDRSISYLTLDDAISRKAALSDPTGFILQPGELIVIDEIQRAPDLLLAIKERVDRDWRPGQFLITGSANILTLPTIRDALPGRADYVRLWPLAQAEIERRDANLVDELFRGQPPTLTEGVDRTEIAGRIAAGGFPDAFDRTSRSRRHFFEAYVDSVVRRDVPDVAHTRDAARIGKLLRLLAIRSASLLSRHGLAGELEADRKTVDHDLHVLEDLMLVRLHPAWHSNLSKREVKTPKAYVTDTGMIRSLIGADAERIAGEPSIAGMAFETFAVLELVKLASWSEASPRLFHYRDRDGREIDTILERADGSIVGVEMKAGATLGSSDFRSLAFLRDKVGGRFRCGAVLYAGRHTLRFGERLFAVPMSALWS